MSKQIQRNGTFLTLAASKYQRVSEYFNPVDRKNIMVQVSLASYTLTNAIKVFLHDSMDGVLTDYFVGDQSEASAAAAKTFAGGAAEQTDLTFPATAGITQGDFVLIDSAQSAAIYMIWLDIDANGTAPTGTKASTATVSISVPTVTGGSAAQNAVLAKTAIGVLMDSDFTVGAVATADIPITQLNSGSVDDPDPENAAESGAGSMVVTVNTAGADNGVVASTNIITSTSHGYITGDKILYGDAGGTAPGGLVDGTSYYVIYLTDNTLSLATTQFQSYAGTAIDLTDSGVGAGHTLSRTVLNIRMIWEDSSDQAQLPLGELVAVYASTAASDAVVIESISVAD
jgi:hypothetical protein